MLRRPQAVALGLGFGAGAMSTWFQMSHGVVCVPLMVSPPMNMAPQIAAGSTAVGVGCRQGLALGLHAVTGSVSGPPLEELIDSNIAFVCGTAAAITAWKSVSWASKAARSTLYRCGGLALIGASAIIPCRNWVRDGNMRPLEREDVYKPLTRFDPTQISMRRISELALLGVAAGFILGTTGVGTSWALAPALVHLGYIQSASPGDEAPTSETTYTVESTSGETVRTVDEVALRRFEQAQSTAMVATMPAIILAAVRHFMVGHVSPLAMPLMGGALFGGYFGAEVMPFCPDEYETLALLAYTFMFGIISVVHIRK